MATVTADPTMRLINSLDDPELFECKEHVAVFKPHKRDFPSVKLTDGTVLPAKTVEVTDKDLEEIAANTNDLYKQDGQLVKLVIGHRKIDPAHREVNQPPVAGFARHYRAEVVDRPGGKQIRLTHTEYIHRGKPQSAAVLNGEYPERSPEYDPVRKVITGVALLTRDQSLPLGTVSYDSIENRCLYSMGTEAMTTDPNAPVSEGDDMNDAEKVDYAKFCKFMKAYSAMGANNGTVPAVVPGQNSGNAASYQDPAFVALQAEIERERGETAKARQVAVYAKVDNLLAPMVDLRKFDYGRERDALAAMPTDEARGVHVQYMLRNYQALPTGGMIRTAEKINLPPVTMGDEPAVPDFAKPSSDHAAACHYMSANPGVQYDDALKFVAKKAA